MSSNFEFLQGYFPQLYHHATQAETMVYSAPRASCFYSRFTLEQAVYWLYDHDPYLQKPQDDNLGNLIHEQTFKDNLTPELFPKIRLIHKMGNVAAHESQPISPKESLQVVEELFHFLYWLCRYYSNEGRNLSKLVFQPKLLNKTQTPQELSLTQLQALETQLSQAEQQRREAEYKQLQTESQLESLKAEIALLKQQNKTLPDTHNYKEADTRRFFIDVLLKEAGWNLTDSKAREYPVTGMPNDSGKGKIDYVLWGDNGLPLGIVEAKATTKDASNGKHQAKLYADCLETSFGQRPVIFYSNGYDTWIWDDLTYPPRLIPGFLTKDQLELMIFRRRHRKKLHLVQINENIVNRNYQKEAIRSITQTFDNTHKKRKGLLVMATGTGKTRTAIALIDLLMGANWVKRVLFLADRNALLTQAFRAFKTHLPKVTPLILNRDKQKDFGTANVVLASYPTMFNLLHRQESDQALCGPGYFDLIIVDEAHRSIYQKYRSLFDYFDALLIGLTATPRAEVHRDTYSIFDLEPGKPTFAYELDDAIKDGYLVPPLGIEVGFKFLQQGIKYGDLSPDEQEEYEAKFRDSETGDLPPEVDVAALNNWLFNINTIDQALELIMTQGLTLDGGDRLGKTIIFARNHAHAELIVQRFDHNYPQYKGQFAQVIDSHNSYAQSLLDDFAMANKQPTIAVSVDMLDTGVDIPEVLNLVFFKPVYSRVKFNQMIGRGTRLCLNLLGIGAHKTEFFIFDLCGNFEFFSQDLETTNHKPVESLTTQLVKKRLELNQLLTKANNSQHQGFQDQILNELHQHVATMVPENFLVRRHLAKVTEFTPRERWNQLTREDVQEVGQYLANLPNRLPQENHLVKRFDLLCLKIQIALLENQKLGKKNQQGYSNTPSAALLRLREQMRDLAHGLEAKKDIPMVNTKLALIKEVQTLLWWQDATIEMIEELRHNLRDLVQFIDNEKQDIVYTNFEDELADLEAVKIPLPQPGFSAYQYRQKIQSYVRENQDHGAIAKLKRNIPLTDADVEDLEQLLLASEIIESRERFQEVFGEHLSLKLFIRQLVGLDRHTAKESFNKYLATEKFSANQVRFVTTIIDYLTQNGVMDAALLYEAPFTDIHQEGLDGIFSDSQADQIVKIIKSFNESVGAKFDI